MPTTTASGATVPAGIDPNNIPSAFVAYDASKDPRLTTAQISALPWSAKPAGWTAYDTTLGRLVISTGAAMVPLMDGRGGIVDGALIFDDANGWRILATTGGVFAVQRRDPTTGAYVDNPLLITESGHVESRSHVADVIVGATGATFVNLLPSPTGKWSVVASSTASNPAVQVQMITATQVKFTLPTLVTADIHYHAIAY